LIARQTNRQAGGNQGHNPGDGQNHRLLTQFGGGFLLFLGPLALLFGMIGLIVTAVVMFMRMSLLYLVAAFAPIVWSASVSASAPREVVMTDVKLSLVPHEFLFPTSKVTIDVPSPIDRKGEGVAVGIIGIRGRAEVSRNGRRVTWSPGSRIAPGPAEFVIEGLVSARGDKLCDHMTVPVNLVRSRAPVPDNVIVEGFSRLKFPVIDAVSGDACSLCSIKPRRIGIVAQHQRDIAIEGTGRFGVNKGLQIRAASGNQDRDSSFFTHCPSTTSPLPG